jgi:hypothetical protein
MQPKRPIVAFLALALGAGGAFAVSAPAQATEAKQLTLDVIHHKRATLKDSASFSGELRSRLDSAKLNYVDRRAKQGLLLDVKRVDAVTDAAASVVAVAEDTTVIDSIDVGSYKTTDDVEVAQGFGAQIHDEAPGSASVSAAHPALGFAGAPSYTGYQLVGQKSLELHPTAYGVKQNVITDYWKYKLPDAKETAAFGAAYRANSDFFVYARRGTGDAQGTGKRLVDLTVRSRPWGGTAGNQRNIIAKAPVGTSQQCTSTGTIGFEYKGASISLPYNNCSAVKGVTTTSSTLEFGADWDGRTGDPQTVEAIASVRAVAGTTPSWADYIWASFTNLPTQVIDYSDYKWTDSGW